MISISSINGFMISQNKIEENKEEYKYAIAEKLFTENNLICSDKNLIYQDISFENRDKMWGGAFKYALSSSVYYGNCAISKKQTGIDLNSAFLKDDIRFVVLYNTVKPDYISSRWCTYAEENIILVDKKDECLIK